MISIGPFSIQVVSVAVAIVLAWVVARVVARRLPSGSGKVVGGTLIDAIFWGIVAARLGYIVQWWDEYWQAPMSMVFIGDQGFIWWLGVLVASMFVVWRTRSNPVLRRPLFAGIVSGVVIWFAAGSVIHMQQRLSPPLPPLALATLDEQPILLNSYVGRPVVLNLWASWCPPCRREMPVLESAQNQFPNIAFVMVNQGESIQQVQAFLDSQNLKLEDVLLDHASQTMKAVGSHGLPTTLFFDEDGRLVDTHLGELTMASLKQKISRYFPRYVPIDTNKE
jgi:thiol-disulfide isomerase/thioredoxin